MEEQKSSTSDLTTKLRAAAIRKRLSFVMPSEARWMRPCRYSVTKP